MKKTIDELIVIKPFNNNIVLVRNADSQKLLFSKGIGFGKKTNDIIPIGTEVDKIFIIQDEQNIKNFNTVIGENENKFLALCEEIIYDIWKDLNEELSENIHISLINHLSFAVQRLKNKEEIENPFLIEIKTLYATEFNIAKKAAQKIEKNIGLKIPDGEVGFITLHIHSARNNNQLSNSIKYGFICNLISEHIESMLKIKIEKDSLDYARFITHIRFALERIRENKKSKNDFLDIIKSKYKNSYEVSCSAAQIIANELDITVDEDEIGYLAMHIERLKISMENVDK